MSLARREMDRLKKLAAPLIEPIQRANAHRCDAFAKQRVRDAIVHAANLSLIVLYGDPKIDEPLSSAWQRCLESDAPELGGDFKKMKDTPSIHPFDDSARWIAGRFGREILSQRPGTDEREKFDAILTSAPLWLLWFTWAEFTITYLQLRQACARIWPIIADVKNIALHCGPPHPSELANCDRSYEIRKRHPALPSGKFEKAPWSDSYRATVNGWLSAIQKGPTTYDEELYRAHESCIKNWLSLPKASRS